MSGADLSAEEAAARSAGAAAEPPQSVGDSGGADQSRYLRRRFNVRRRKSLSERSASEFRAGNLRSELPARLQPVSDHARGYISASDYISTKNCISVGGNIAVRENISVGEHTSAVDNIDSIPFGDENLRRRDQLTKSTKFAANSHVRECVRTCCVRRVLEWRRLYAIAMCRCVSVLASTRPRRAPYPALASLSTKDGVVPHFRPAAAAADDDDEFVMAKRRENDGLFK